MDFVPPFAVKAVRKRQRRCDVYPSYDLAARACAGYGYEHAALCDMIYEKIVRYRESIGSQRVMTLDVASSHTMLGLSLAFTGDQLRVVDFGGACGAQYFLARACFGSQMRLKWAVVETPEMVRRGKELADGQLQFYDDVSTASAEMGRIDLIMSSGALQYVPEPYATLTTVLDAGASRILLTRMPLTTTDGELVGVHVTKISHNGPGAAPGGPDGVARYPVTAPSKQRVEQMLAHRYAVRLQFNEEQEAYWLGSTPVDLFGYFGELKQGRIG